MQKPHWEELSKFNHADLSEGFLLWRVYLLWKRKVESCLRPHEITHIQFVLLAGIAYLTRDDKLVTQIELAKFTYCDVNMTSQVLRTLEKKLLVTRVTKDGDERAKYPKLTADGYKKLKLVMHDVETVDAQFFKLSDKKQDRLKKIMLHLLAEQPLKPHALDNKK